MTTTIIGLAGLVFLLLIGAVAVMFIPKKKKSINTALQSFAAPLHPVPESLEMQLAPARTLRGRELDEDSDALAEEFRRLKHEQYLANLRAEAAAFFAEKKKAS